MAEQSQNIEKAHGGKTAGKKVRKGGSINLNNECMIA